MKRFFDLAQRSRADYVPTQDEIDRRTELDELLTKDDRKQMLYHWAARVLRDENNDIESAITSSQIAWLKPEQQNEVIQTRL